MGTKSAQNLLKEIEESRKLDFTRVLFGLGIRHVGERTAQLLAEHFTTMDRLEAAATDELERVHEVGPKLAESIYRFFRENQNRELIERLRLQGLNMVMAQDRDHSAKTFSGKTFVLTGTLEGMTREEAIRLIEQRGGHVTPSVSKKTAFVLAGRDPGSKLAKARELEVPVLDEETFRSMLEHGL
jgi:DNA ligase (NAD+)